MEISKTYNPAPVEEKWYQYWMNHHMFRSVPDEREPYTIVIPPPNVTGVLHMGHMLNNTIQDVLVRRARMQGKNACWVPGTDHASIATEAKVVALLLEKGIKKSDLSREAFLKHAFEWKEKYGGIILEQLKKLGASCDWERTRFTMEPDLSDAVTGVFIDLYNKGHIYRGVRMINWDPKGQTAVSDEEVIHKEVNSKLFYVQYPLYEKDERVTEESIREKLGRGHCITIATVRPETILGDTGVCVHPGDERYISLKGKYALIPFVNRKVPIIYDTYIDPAFGTGALKVTPAHDINDYNLGVKHQLEVIDTIEANGTMSAAAGKYQGMDRFAVRKLIVNDLEAAGYLVKTEDYKNKVGYSERTDAVIEPKLSMQWFLKMENISKPALDAVLNGDVQLIPDKFVNTYRYWMENVRDWCISRQLWWGQRIPAWYASGGEFVVAANEEEARQKFMELNEERRMKGESPIEISSIKQDEDVVDTWFSSWLWPISVFDGFKDPGNKDINYYYPTNDLVTAPEILFFWVARMIIAGYEYRGKKPFSHVYLTGIVRDKQGRKMSKSLGNSPDPLELITKYGADGVRMGMLLCSPAGNDLPFDESMCEQGRNFNNKIWNAFRLVNGWESNPEVQQTESEKLGIACFEALFNKALADINGHFERYRMSDALMAVYKLVWDDFCSWFLEMIKPEFVQDKPLPVSVSTLSAVVRLFEDVLKLMHPFMPFITEELWHMLKPRQVAECIMLAPWPSPYNVEGEQELLAGFEISTGIIQHIRNIRNKNGLSPREPLELILSGQQPELERFFTVIQKLANLRQLIINEKRPDNGIHFVVGKTECFVPRSVKVDDEEEKSRLWKELEYLKGFLVSVEKKLGNERFMQNARPEVVALEKSKQADALVKIKLLEDQLSSLGAVI